MQPNYGYFSHHATIFTPPKDGFDIISFRDVAHFQETVAERYEREYGLEPTEGAQGGLGRQVWHTPTELFKVSDRDSKAFLYYSDFYSSLTTLAL